MKWKVFSDLEIPFFCNPGMFYWISFSTAKKVIMLTGLLTLFLCTTKEEENFLFYFTHNSKKSYKKDFILEFLLFSSNNFDSEFVYLLLTCKLFVKYFLKLFVCLVHCFVFLFFCFRFSFCFKWAFFFSFIVFLYNMPLTLMHSFIPDVIQDLEFWFSPFLVDSFKDT